MSNKGIASLLFTIGTCIPLDNLINTLTVEKLGTISPAQIKK